MEPDRSVAYSLHIISQLKVTSGHMYLPSSALSKILFSESVLKFVLSMPVIFQSQ